MKAPPLANQYDRLTAEERFRLILAANGRGDEAERDRLKNAGAQITLSMPDHSPYAHAFDELAMLIYIELLDEAASYMQFLRFPNDADDDLDDDESQEEDDADEETNAEADDSLEEEDGDQEPAFIRNLDLTLAAGYVLRTKANGWKLFCERLNVPPFLHWERLPGFDRLQRTMAVTEKAAFVPEGFLRWLNRNRPKGAPELTAVPLTVEGIASEITEAYKKGAKWWGGE